MKKLLLLSLMVLFGCAASVTTEQYVGEYEKQKSLDEVEITKVDGLKIVEVKFNKDVEERYPELGEKIWTNSRTTECGILCWKVQPYRS